MAVEDPLIEAWGALAKLFFTKRETFLTVSKELGLTPPQTHALMSLSDGPLRMRALADSLVCDASYITAIVDRLEELSLAERLPSAIDRRVKEVALTAAGRSALDQLHRAMFEPPAALRTLPAADQVELARIARQLVPAAEPPTAFCPR